MKYTFLEIEQCNMCGDNAEGHKIIGHRLNGQTGLKPGSKKGITVSVAKCTKCGLIYSNPLPIPFDLQDHYGIPPEHYWTAEYFKLSLDQFSYEIGIAKKLLNFRKQIKALDIGAGLGKNMLAMSDAGFDTYGFEPSVPFYERAISKMDISPERLKQGAMEEMHYEENSFDFITFGAVLEHLYDPNHSLEKALQWLKPAGIIHIEVPSSEWLISKLINRYYRLRGTRFVTNISPMHEPFHLYEFAVKSFQLNALRLGYEVAYYKHFVGEIPSVPKIFHPLLKTYMKWSNTGLQLVIWLRKPVSKNCV